LFTLIDQHYETFKQGFESLDKKAIEKAGKLILKTIQKKKNIFTIGNGASAAIAQHWACDYTKGCSNLKTGFIPRVISLAANIPLMTAISNDTSYEEVYSYQIERLGNPGDILIAISSSGSSPNIVKAIRSANMLDIKTISLTGFDGGLSRILADINIHVDCQEYEATEDIHQAVMHIIAKSLRNNRC
jgi:phosphoheptose isomerase